MCDCAYAGGCCRLDSGYAIRAPSWAGIRFCHSVVSLLMTRLLIGLFRNMNVVGALNGVGIASARLFRNARLASVRIYAFGGNDILIDAVFLVSIGVTSRRLLRKNRRLVLALGNIT